MAEGTARSILRAVLFGLSLGLLLVVAFAASILIVVPKATGSTPLTVLTDSMTPTLPPGTLVVVRPIDPRDVRVGQVVTYQLVSGRPEVVTHRVVAVTSTSTGEVRFTFRGDANALPDAAAVRPEQLRGAVWYSVPVVGWANEAVNGVARKWVVPAVAALLFAYAAVMLSLGTRQALQGRVRTRYRRAVTTGHGRRVAPRR